ncbi:unnamed protein product [Withania somnifera]
MKKLSYAVLFLFFTLSLARTPLNLPENDVTRLKLPSENDAILPELHKTVREKDVTLPELPKALPENDVILTKVSKNPPETDESLSADRIPSRPYREETRTFQTVPLKLVRLRPINRRFRLRYNLPFRLCHHHLKPVSRRQIPFGNDMIPSSQRNIDFDKLVYRIGLRRIPSDPVNFHQHNDRKIWKSPDDRQKFGEMKKDQLPHHHHHRHNDDIEDNDHDHEHEQRKISKFLEDGEKFWGMNLKDQLHHHHHHHDEKAKEKKKGGFMRGIRKFLHHYFD